MQSPYAFQSLAQFDKLGGVGVQGDPDVENGFDGLFAPGGKRKRSVKLYTVLRQALGLAFDGAYADIQRAIEFALGSKKLRKLARFGKARMSGVMEME